VLVDAQGRVARVWVIGEPTFEPPWPEFGDAIVAHVRAHRYKPAVVDGARVPFCIATTLNIDWR
jgi:hypothetical protein